MGKTDDLLVGAIDMHCHCYPDFSLTVPHRFTDEENARLMKEAGMSGVVLKSHFWPTIAAAECLRKAVPDFAVFSSIALNASVGGPRIWAVESAIKQGVKVVWLPTWSAKNDIQRSGVNHLVRQYLPTVETFTEEEGISITDQDGKLLPAVLEVLSMVKEHDIPLFTGHISPAESIALARGSKQIGYKKLVFGHPDSNSVGANFDQIIEMANQGAYVEICALGLMPLYQRITPLDMAKTIHAVGANKCILSTDFFFEWAPSGPEQLRMLIAALLMVGVKEEEIKQMAQTNPQILLGLI